MKNIHNQNVAELVSALHDNLLYAGVKYLLWRYRNFSLAFIFLGLLKPSLLHLL